MKLSVHARRRWAQRCGGFDLRVELAALRRPSKRVRRLINEACQSGGRGVRYLVSSGGVVFVCAEDEDVVLTVFTLMNAKAMCRAARSNWLVAATG